MLGTAPHELQDAAPPATLAAQTFQRNEVPTPEHDAGTGGGSTAPRQYFRRLHAETVPGQAAGAPAAAAAPRPPSPRRLGRRPTTTALAHLVQEGAEGGLEGRHADAGRARTPRRL
eukprot:2380523-Alexandrium_andersonii.AAC.1